MSKRPCEEPQVDEPESEGVCWMRKSKVPRLGLVPCSHLNKRPARQRYLYLVLDDWERGYSIHRVDEDDFYSDAGLEARPADCPVVRIEAQHASSLSFAAHGTKILAMHPSGFSPGIPVFDTETLGMAVCPFPKSRAVLGATNLVFASAGDRLFVFVSRYLEVLGPEPLPTHKSWSWTSVEPLPPFESRLVSSYALHPDGRTIFVSVKNWSSSVKAYHRNKRNSTFTFDTEQLEWTHLGEWLLPFRGRAHYDRDLDAWVGICPFKEGAGHLSCCDIPPAVACKTMPSWKLGKDVFFDEDHIRHSGATLVYMGDSRFCLIECQVPEDNDSSPRLRVVTMTSCVLKYDKAGELTAHHRAYASLSYHTAHENLNLDLDPVAFWM